MDIGWPLLPLWALVGALMDTAVVSGTKCYKDQALGDTFQDNIYHCDIGSSTECCEENKKFTCCEPKSSHNLEQQFVLWGTIFGIVAIISFIWICYRKDTYMCEGLSLAARCKGCCRCCARSGDAKNSTEGNDKPEDGDHNVSYSNLDHSPGFTPTANTSMPKNIPFDEPDRDSDSGRGSGQSEANSPAKNVENIEMADLGQANEKLKKIKGKKSRKRSKALLDNDALE